jgi:hypothetical protein
LKKTGNDRPACFLAEAPHRSPGEAADGVASPFFFVVFFVGPTTFSTTFSATFSTTFSATF